MNKRLIGSLLLALMLAACSSKPMKDTPVAVEDKSTEMTQSAGDAAGSGDDSATSGMADSSMSVNPLTDPSNILSKRSIYFDYDSDEVKSEYRSLVEAHAKYLLDHPDARVTLQGNTDERGAREYNLSLGQRRSVSVKQVMNLLGVQDRQIETVSFGEEKAGANCTDDSCWKEDRRVDIVYQGE
jgi:peptidoglycan-associated lipoprotein